MTETPDTRRYRYPRSCIIVFARAPVRGRVKTRLATGLGEDAALAIYRQLLSDTVERVARARLTPLELHIDDDPAHPEIVALARHCDALRRQSGEDLGERMYRALRNALQRYRSAVLIGSDCPLMDADYLEQALRCLERGTRAVFGPGEDGGYVLVGARRVDRRMFSNIAWGCDSVMRQTRDALHRAAIEFEELEPLWDVDHPEDFHRWAALRPDVRQLTEGNDL